MCVFQSSEGDVIWCVLLCCLPVWNLKLKALGDKIAEYRLEKNNILKKAKRETVAFRDAGHKDDHTATPSWMWYPSPSLTLSTIVWKWWNSKTSDVCLEFLDISQSGQRSSSCWDVRCLEMRYSHWECIHVVHVHGFPSGEIWEPLLGQRLMTCRRWLWCQRLCTRPPQDFRLSRLPWDSQ